MAFIYYLFLSFLPAFVGGYITSKNIYPWYGTIKKPDFTPPDYAFSYVWSFIYFSLAISVFLASKKVKENNVNIMKIFYVYIFLNATWSCLFFGLHLIVGGLVLCIMMFVITSYSIHYTKLYERGVNVDIEV